MREDRHRETDADGSHVGEESPTVRITEAEGGRGCQGLGVGELGRCWSKGVAWEIYRTACSEQNFPEYLKLAKKVDLRLNVVTIMTVRAGNFGR